MPIAKSSGGTFQPAPEGTFVARCFGVISLGTQPQTNSMYSPTFKVMLMWELPTETITMDKELVPMVVSKEYTLSIGKKANLRKDLESWRGRAFTDEELAGFAVEKVIGQPCMITIGHQKTERGVYAKVMNVAKVLKGVEVGGQHHKNVHYEIEHGKNAAYQSLPEWVRKKIDQCHEWNATHDSEEPQEAAAATNDTDNEVPF